MSLAEQLDAYAAYHGDTRNKITHFFGVPLVTFSIFLFLGWFRLKGYENDTFASGATLFYLIVFLFYLWLDWKVALCQLPFSLALLWLADWEARRPYPESITVFLATFVGGWIIQLVGHAFEGKRPALADNLTQIFNAPLFLNVEVAFLLGLRQDLRAAVKLMHAPASPTVAVNGAPEIKTPVQA